MKKIKSAAGSNNAATVWAALFAIVLLLSLFNIVTCHLYEQQGHHPDKAHTLIKQNHSSRRLLVRSKTAATAAAETDDVQTKGYYFKGKKQQQQQPKKAVEASLKKAPPSVPNPTQNK